MCIPFKSNIVSSPTARITIYDISLNRFLNLLYKQYLNKENLYIKYNSDDPLREGSIARIIDITQHNSGSLRKKKSSNHEDFSRYTFIIQWDYVKARDITEKICIGSGFFQTYEQHLIEFLPDYTGPTVYRKMMITDYINQFKRPCKDKIGTIIKEDDLVILSTNYDIMLGKVCDFELKFEWDSKQKKYIIHDEQGVVIKTLPITSKEKSITVRRRNSSIIVINETLNLHDIALISKLSF